MYSIHIINHNYLPNPILDQLVEQCSSRTEEIRLNVWDDFSSPEYQENLSLLQEKYGKAVNWRRLHRNHGRSTLRQKILHSESKGWVISIDSDMTPETDFVVQMLSDLQDKGTVYKGFHFYQDEAPADKYLLHWNYGRLREIPVQNKNPYFHFSTGIYAIHASLAKDLYFEHAIQTYGHEDTLFGLLLKEKGIPVEITAMKAVHHGLSPTEIFIDKQLKAVHNLQVVLSHYPEYQNSLIRWGQRINRIPGIKQSLASDRLKQFCLKKLNRYPDRLIYLDVLKLNEYLGII